ncbi:MAG: hypothetical protein IJ557_02485 [Bacteroidaceae bacterium]|nr:hypothetical protein [Bacteroidaceae bacterium]
MKAAEIIKLASNFLELLHKNGIKITDYQYLRLWEDYQNMLSRGDKVSYIVAMLAARYDMSEREVYKILRRYKTNCQTGAAE